MQKHLEYLGLHTCVILNKDKIVFSSDASGVKPLLDYYHQYGTSNISLTVVDKIMGSGAVLLAKRINADTIYTPIISKDAIELAHFYHMNVQYLEIVPYIINQAKTGRCPIESSVLGITDTTEGYLRILDTLKKLSQNK